MAGYSNTPLYKKLGLKSESSPCLLHAPEDYARALCSAYPATIDRLDGRFDWLQAFYTETDRLEQEFANLKAHLKPTGQLWISWPKRSSGINADLNENIVRDIGLKNGLVDVKIAAVDEVWSGLKFVYRRQDRSAAESAPLPQ